MASTNGTTRRVFRSGHIRLRSFTELHPNVRRLRRVDHGDTTRPQARRTSAQERQTRPFFRTSYSNAQENKAADNTELKQREETQTEENEKESRYTKNSREKVKRMSNGVRHRKDGNAPYRFPAHLLKPQVREYNKTSENYAVNDAYNKTVNAGRALVHGRALAVRAVRRVKVKRDKKREIRALQRSIRTLKDNIKKGKSAASQNTCRASVKRNIRKFRVVSPPNMLLVKRTKAKNIEQVRAARQRVALAAKKQELRTKKKELKQSAKGDLGAVFSAAILQKGVSAAKNTFHQGQDHSAANYAQEMYTKGAYHVAEFTTKTGAKALKLANNGFQRFRTSRKLRTPGKGASASKSATAQAKKAVAKRAQAKQARATSKAAEQAKKLAVQTARRTAEAVKKIIIAMANTVKTILLAASSGAIFIVMFVLIFGAAVAFASPWGMFYSDEDPTETGLKDAIQEISSEWLQTLANHGGVYEDNDFGSETAGIPNIYEIVCVYAVKVSTDKTKPLDAATMDDEKKTILKQVVEDMRSISTQTVTYTVPDEDGNETTITEQRAVVYSRTWQDMIAFYHFDADQADTLERLINEDSMFRHLMETLGYNVQGGVGGQLTNEEWQAILDSIGNMDAMQQQIVALARSYLGYRYSEKLRGQTYYENGEQKKYMDCSYFTRELFRAFGIEVEGTAAYQKKWCENNGVLVNTSDLQVGDIVFFRSPGNTSKVEGITHCALYIGNGMIIDASASNGMVVCRKLWTGGDPYLYAAGRPFATS